jgi:GNAT superfamily N-acetyltransferase
MTDHLWSEPLVTRDGAHLQVRPLEAEDREELRDGINGLSPDSRYMRFLTPKPEATPDDLTYLTTLDHDHHEALVAVEPATGIGVAVARYVIVDDQPPVTAEIAVTVTDEWQGRGVGGGLLRRLAAVAQARGITRFSGTKLDSNATMIKLLSSLGPESTRHCDAGTVQMVVELTEDERG